MTRQGVIIFCMSTPAGSPNRNVRHNETVYLWLLGIVIAIGIVVYVAWRAISYPPAPISQQAEQHTSTTTGIAPSPFPTVLPQPTASDYVSAEQNFQYLVSYTDNGFTPATLAVNKGETIRWTNNSSSLLTLALPNTTSEMIGRGAYYQYTFDTVGTFSYAAGSSPYGGTITVQ